MLYNKTIVYNYDNSGNIISAKTYALFGENESPVGSCTEEVYAYSAGNWGDLLVSYNGNAITYDGIGNPVEYYNGFAYTWEGRRLVGAVNGTDNYTFTYNDEGIRTSKTKNGVTTTYYLNGSQIVGEETDGNITVYIYDSAGSVTGMQTRECGSAADDWSTYFFLKNLQGDIVAV